MNWSRLRNSGNESVFKGSQLVSSILERHPTRFRSRATALKFCRQLFNDGIIRGVFATDTFEDSVQLYTWKDQNGSTMTSYPVNSPRKSYGFSSADVTLTKRELYKQKESIKPVDVRRDTVSSSAGYSQEVNDYLRDVKTDITPDDKHRVTSYHSHVQQPHMNSYHTTWNLQRASTASSESSVDILSHSYGKNKDKHNPKTTFMPAMTHSRDHDVIPEEVIQEEHVPVMERTGTSTEYEGSSSIPRSTNTDVSTYNDVEGLTSQRNWAQNYQNSYSDNEKQLIEQMKRMKKEHSHILRTYEDRINKLMAKMHELRSIAEMLENSSTKSSPYGMMANKTNVLSFLTSKGETERKPLSNGNGLDNPPPLPPRPGRGSRLNPNKPLIQTDANMKQLPWSRIILKDDSLDEPTTIWHTMMEPKIDPEDIERLFSTPVISQTDGVTLYDDIIIRRGRSRQQLVSIYEIERSKRIVTCMKCLRATLSDVIATVSSLDTSQISHEGFAELVELLSPQTDIDKILYHVRKKGAGHLDHPEYLVFELSKVDHFKDRVEFIRFRFKLLWHLFEIDQQLRELNTACDEIANSTSLKNLLETLLAVGNYLNGATEMGQADGYGLDVLNKLKEIQDRHCKGTLLEFVLKTYCQIYESEVEIGCPTRFRLPEPSNMRHASQVSFEGIQDALTNLHSDLRHVRDKLLDPRLNKDVMRPMDSFRVSAENFFAAALEVIGDQEKVLQDTRDVFDKTTSYFVMDKQQMSPNQFFQIWAVFLHDCKYFWKLAHRRLAKERFELEFKYKGHESANSIQGGYGIFKAGVMKGIESTNVADPKTSTQERRSNRWVTEMPDPSRPAVPPKPSRSTNTDSQYTASHSDRSASPKPLTCIPPSSGDVHKPLPKAPIQSTAISTSVADHPPNYENQSEYDRLHQQHGIPFNQVISSPHEMSPANGTYYRSPESVAASKDKKSSQQFSLKAWLKREREQVRKGVESDCNDSPTQEMKSPHSSKPFTKFKNSMFSKFSGGSSSKKSDQHQHKRSKEDKSITSPNKHVSTNDQHPVPYDAIRPNYNRQPDGIMAYNQTPNKDTSGALHLDSLEEYNRPIPDTIISPIDDLEVEESIIPNQNGPVDVQPALVTGDNVDANVKLSDVNNNEKYGKRDLASKYDGSPYGRVQRDSVCGRDDKPSVHNVEPQNVDTKRVVAQSVPLYKARIINNYENQGKFENPDVVRQVAEPVKAPPVDNYRGRAANEQPLSDQTNAFSRFGNDNTQFKRMSNDINDTVQKRDNYQPSNNTTSPYESSARTSRHSGVGTRSPDSGRSPKGTPRKRAVMENRNYFTPGNRVPMNVQSIGSLIDKFDKYNNNDSDQPDVAQSQTSPSSSRPSAVMSTPTTNDLTEMSPPLPPRTSLSPGRGNKTISHTDHDGRHSSNYPSSDKHSTMSPSTRLDNLTSSSTFSPSSYMTPQANQTQSKTIWSPNSSNNNYYTPPTSNSQRSRDTFSSSHMRSEGEDITTRNGGQGSSSRGQYGMNGYHEESNDIVDERDDGYRARLRKAANMNHTTYGRLTKASPMYTGRQSFGSPNTEAVLSPYNSSAAMKQAIHNNESVAYMAI
ncbi:Fmn2p [Mactra antiquata]